jgi:hypothetical protein
LVAQFINVVERTMYVRQRERLGGETLIVEVVEPLRLFA